MLKITDTVFISISDIELTPIRALQSIYDLISSIPFCQLSIKQGY